MEKNSNVLAAAAPLTHRPSQIPNLRSAQHEFILEIRAAQRVNLCCDQFIAMNPQHEMESRSEWIDRLLRRVDAFERRVEQREAENNLDTPIP